MVFRTMLLSVACLVLGAAASSASADVVKGRVVDANGRPVVGAQVAPYWEIIDDEVVPWQGTSTDESGWFELEIELVSFRQMLYAMNVERTLGGYVIVGPTSGVADAQFDVGEMKLEPLVEIRGDYYCDALNAPPSRSIVSVAVVLDGQEMMVGSSRSTLGKFWFKLPPGEYHFFHRPTDFQGVTEFRTLPADEVVVDRGTIKIEQTILARLYGKAPPKLTVTDARGVGKTVSLKDFRGKWTLIEFWAYW